MGQNDAGSGMMRPLAGDPARDRVAASTTPPSDPSWVIETEVSPFHCLYQDALFFHTQSRLARSESEAVSGRFARVAFLAYLSASDALVHQAAIELTRPEFGALVADPGRPKPLREVLTLLPAVVAEGSSKSLGLLELPPWPQFAELLALRDGWLYPGPPSARRAYYRAPRQNAAFEPLAIHQIPATLNLAHERIQLPRTGLPRDPYALRPEHVDTARSVLDAAIESLDRCLGGALTEGNRHRREPVRVVHPPGASME